MTTSFCYFSWGVRASIQGWREGKLIHAGKAELYFTKKTRRFEVPVCGESVRKEEFQWWRKKFERELDQT